MEFSQLHPHSIGLVSRIKPLGTKEIKAIPIEIRMAAQEELLSGQNEQTAGFATNDGEDNIKVVSDNSITASWINLNSNRISPPDVRRGDMVMLYRLGESDKYFWSDYNSKGVKRLETVVYAFSADKEASIKPDLSNAYYLEISTHNKTLTLHTSQADGEPFGYDVQLNTLDGNFRMLDTAGNTVWLDSKNTCIGAQNANGTWLHLDKKNLNAFAPNNINYEAKKDINFKCTNLSIKATESITFNTKAFSVEASDSIAFTTKDYTLNASSSVTVTTATYTSTSTSNTFNCPASVFTGSVAAAGITVGGGAKGGSGNCEVAGSLIATLVNAPTITCGSITATSGSFGSLTHGGGKCC